MRFWPFSSSKSSPSYQLLVANPEPRVTHWIQRTNAWRKWRTAPSWLRKVILIAITIALTALFIYNLVTSTVYLSHVSFPPLPILNFKFYKFFLKNKRWTNGWRNTTANGYSVAKMATKKVPIYVATPIACGRVRFRSRPHFTNTFNGNRNPIKSFSTKLPVKFFQKNFKISNFQWIFFFFRILVVECATGVCCGIDGSAESKYDRPRADDASGSADWIQHRHHVDVGRVLPEFDNDADQFGRLR